MTTFEDYLTVQEVMELLGVSKQTVYTMAERYNWTMRKIGAARLYLRGDVLATPDPAQRRQEAWQKRRDKSISTDIPAKPQRPLGKRLKPSP